MPDITMCANKKCPLRDMCYRYRAIPDKCQTYALFKPTDKVATCDSFWNCRGYKLRPTEEVDKQKTPFDVP